MLLKKNALPEGTYTSLPIKKKLNDLIDVNDNSTPINAYVSEIKNSQLNKENISEADKNRLLQIEIEKVFLYNNKIAGVVNDAYLNSFGYAIWYFYNCNGTWASMGEGSEEEKGEINNVGKRLSV